MCLWFHPAQIFVVVVVQAIEKEVKKEVDEATEFAKNAPEPEAKELYTQVYLNNEIPIRAADGTMIFS